MIKIIVFDLLDVLIKKRKTHLSNLEKKLKDKFLSCTYDSEYLMFARNEIKKDSIIMYLTENIIEKIYIVNDKEIFKKIKEKYKDVKIVIATNHLSFIRNYIGEALNVDYLDDLIISTEIHKMRPNANLYEHIIHKYNVKPNEILDICSNEKLCNKSIGINNIIYNKNEDLFNIICNAKDNIENS